MRRRYDVGGIFPVCEKLLRSYILILHTLQEASNMLVIPILKLQSVQGYIFDCHRYSLNHIATKNVRLVTL